MGEAALKWGGDLPSLGDLLEAVRRLATRQEIPATVAAEAEAESRRRMLAWRMLDLIPLPWMIVDGAGIIVSAGAAVAALVGTTTADLIGRPLDDLIPERLRGRHGEGFARVFSERTAGVQFRQATCRPATRLSDGQEIEVYVLMILPPAGEADDLAGAFLITEEMRAAMISAGILREVP